MASQSTAPDLHVRPARGWLNDPNGLTRHRDRWHVFFQHNPARAQHSDIHWGHVSSGDLRHWSEHPVAFGPQPGGPDQGGCWSGAFLGWSDQPAMAYTAIRDSPQGSTVCVRFALDDDLERWSDPIVVASEPAGVGIRMMRDPAPFEWQGRRFALLGAGMTDGTPAVLLFSCVDVLSWRYEGVWLDGRDPVAGPLAPGDMWECPQLLRFDQQYVLVLSLQTKERLEDVVYLVGDLDSVSGDSVSSACDSSPTDVQSDSAEPALQPGDGIPRFTARTGALLDYGPDFYAPQAVDDGGAGPLMFGWVRQVDVPDEDASSGVAGCLTLPRRLSLVEDRLRVTPDPALSSMGSTPAEVAYLQGPSADGAGAWATAPLPRRSRISIAPRTGSPVMVELVTDHSRTEVLVGTGGCDIWLDGEVAEVYRPGDVAATVRAPGARAWSLQGRLDPGRITAQVLDLPSSKG